jgi:hypothetical protein
VASSRKELTPHQQARARFNLAAQQAGKLQYADPQIRQEITKFVRDYPGEPIVRLVLGAARPVQPRGESREQRPRNRSRSGRGRGQRPPPKSDDPPLGPRRRLSAAERRVLKLLSRPAQARDCCCASRSGARGLPPFREGPAGMSVSKAVELCLEHQRRRWAKKAARS